MDINKIWEGLVGENAPSFEEVKKAIESQADLAKAVKPFLGTLGGLLPDINTMATEPDRVAREDQIRAAEKARILAAVEREHGSTFPGMLRTIREA